jgi:hypothetical protein
VLDVAPAVVADGHWSTFERLLEFAGADGRGRRMAEPRRSRSIVFDGTRWAGFRFRPDDIVISTPPKSGTTWMQMLCAMVVLGTHRFDRS